MFTYTFDSSSVFNGSVTNDVFENEFEGADERMYGNGLGVVLSGSYAEATNDYGTPSADSMILIYYTKGTQY